MNKTNSTLTKTCNACGIQKPLSAFLQLSGKDSGTYGSICSTCRQANKDKASLISDVEEGTRTTTSVTIDSKTKVQAELDQKQQHQQTEEDYHAERDKDQLIEGDRTNKVDTQSKDQRKHRESLFGKRSFLTTTTSQKTPAASSATERAAQQAAQEAHGLEQTAKQETATKEDLKEKEIDLTAPVEDTRFGKKQKFGIGIDELQKQGPGPMFRTFGTQKQEQQKKDTPSEFIEKTWGPSSPRSK